MVLWYGLFLQQMWPAWRDVSKKARGVYETSYAKTGTSQRDLARCKMWMQRAKYTKRRHCFHFSK